MAGSEIIMSGSEILYRGRGIISGSCNNISGSVIFFVVRDTISDPEITEKINDVPPCSYA